MLTTQKAQIIGVKKFKGDVDGNHYDSCKLRILMPVPKDSEREKGFNVAEVSFGDSSNFEKFSGLSFPVTAELDYLLENRSGKMVMTLADVRFK